MSYALAPSRRSNFDFKNFFDFAAFSGLFSFISSFVRSDIFDKSKVLLKPSVSVVFYSPLNCQRQYHLRSKYHCHRQYHSPKANKTFLRLRRNLNPSRSDTALLPSSLFLITCPRQAALITHCVIAKSVRLRFGSYRNIRPLPCSSSSGKLMLVFSAQL